MIPQPLLDDIAKGKVLPFIGAGFSLNAEIPGDKSMPDWKKLTEGLLEHLRTDMQDLLEVASEYQRNFGRIQLIETIRALLHIDEVRPGRVHQSFALITSFDTIYTTNFDFLLEDAYKEVFRNNPRSTNVRPHRVLVGETQLPSHGGPTYANIIKMHGDMNQIEYLVITKEDYREYLDKHPVIATHLASMLITRTPLFLGYSLTDPNLLQIKELVTKRLGQFERMAYIVAFDRTDEEIEKYNKQNLHVINLKSNPKSKSELLSELLEEIYNYTTVNPTEKTMLSRQTDEEPLNKEQLKSVIKNNQTQILESISDVCFVTFGVTDDNDSIYFYVVKPLVEQYGLRLVRPDEFYATEVPIMDNIRATILQSRLMIADITTQNANVMYEIGIAIANNKSIILLSQDEIPRDLINFPYIKYENTPEGLNALYQQFQTHVENILLRHPLTQAQQLFDNHFYGQAVITIMSFLDLNLENFLREIDDLPASKLNFKSMVDRLVSLNIIDNTNTVKLFLWRKIRNEVVHRLYTPKKEEASEIINGVKAFVDYLKSVQRAAHAWWKILNNNDRQLLTERFLGTVYIMSIRDSREKNKDKSVTPQMVFNSMKMGGYSEVVLPMIVKTLKTEGYIAETSDGKIQLTENGKRKIRKSSEK